MIFESGVGYDPSFKEKKKVIVQKYFRIDIDK